MKPFAGYNTGFIDFPGRMALTMYFTGCNLRCPFCHNKDVVESDGTFDLDDMVRIAADINETIPRSALGLGVVFSGGEPTVSTYYSKAVQAFNGRMPMAIHTNGLVLPDGISPFDAVVLSLKPLAVVNMTASDYVCKLVVALRHYELAYLKEIRIVDMPETRDEYMMLLTMLREHILGWGIRYVPNSLTL